MQGRIAFAFAAFAVLLSALAASGQDPSTTLQQQRELISSVNLINGLHLSGKQLQLLLQINREAELLRQEHTTAYAAKLDEAGRAFDTLLEYFTQDQPAPQEVELRAQQLNRELQDAEDAYHARLSELGGRIEEVLTDGQREIIASFKPCLVPPRDLREPARAGQVGSSLMGEMVLTQYRILIQRFEDIQKNADQDGAGGPPGGMDRGRIRPGGSNRGGRSGGPGASNPRAFSKDEIRERFFERFFPRYFDRYEQLVGKLTEEEKQAEEQRVIQVFDRAAAMTQVEFSLNAENLSNELLAPIAAGEERINEAMDTLAGVRSRLSRAARFLINPALIPILKQRAIEAAGAV